MFSRTPQRCASCAVVARRRVHTLNHVMVGKERRKVSTTTNGTHARSAAAMGNAESLVKVHVRDVGAKFAGPADPNHGIEIGTVHVNLAAVLMNDLADLRDRRLEHTVGGRVGDHRCRKTVFVRLRLGTQILDIDIAAFVAAHDHDF